MLFFPSQSYGGTYIENLRGATQSDTYILRGDPAGETYEPTYVHVLLLSFNLIKSFSFC